METYKLENENFMVKKILFCLCFGIRNLIFIPISDFVFLVDR